jgi:hypothetical protein
MHASIICARIDDPLTDECYRHDDLVGDD